jgi:hypothetical protein
MIPDRSQGRGERRRKHRADHGELSRSRDGARALVGPPHRYECEWNVVPRSSFPEGEKSVVRWELCPSQGGTLLTVTHSRVTTRTAEVFRVGLEAFLDRLEAQLEDRPLPDWEARVREHRGSDFSWA